MVALKYLLTLTTVFATTVLAQAEPEPSTDAQAEAFWDELLEIAPPSVKARVPDAEPEAVPEAQPEAEADDLEGRQNNRQRRGDPYQGRQCPRELYPVFPKGGPYCKRDKCYYAFIDGQRGSPDRHCPANAFNFCCLWLDANDYSKKWAIKFGFVFKNAPWTRQCRYRDRQRYDSYKNRYNKKEDKFREESIFDTIYNIDDVCSCSLQHKVQVDTDSGYYRLRNKQPKDRVCRKKEF